MTKEQGKRNLGRIVFNIRSGDRYFLKEMIGHKCIVNRMVGYLDENRKYQECKSEINYCSDIEKFSTKKYSNE